MKRRKFLEKSTLSSAALMAAPFTTAAHGQIAESTIPEPLGSRGYPMVIATWDVPNATARAWEVLSTGGSALDAVEKGVMVEEADENNQSVGKGGRPDRDGNVTLDACIMDKGGKCGSVVCLQNILHPISVARRVMEDTPHVMLAGTGAEIFAYEKGFEKTELLTENSRKEWLAWKESSQYKPVINIENHDTIGMLALDSEGNISGACTTSGMAYKMAGRVGDSPIIGAGLYVDNEVGGATATGLGEEVVRTVGSFLIVELMRQGKTPQEACEEGVRRIIAKNSDYRDFQVGFIAVNKKGETGGYCIHPGFSYRIFNSEGHVNKVSTTYINP